MILRGSPFLLMHEAEGKNQGAYVIKPVTIQKCYTNERRMRVRRRPERTMN